jgi:autotransporter-associated beta strand protein
MNRKMVALTCLPLLIWVPSAPGRILLELVDRGLPTNGSFSAVGYSAFTLRLSTDGELIRAVDFSTHMQGIFGPFVQQWTSTFEDGTYDAMSPGWNGAQNLGPTWMNFDSHFLPVGQTLAMIPPTEDATFGPVGSQFGAFPANTTQVGYGQGSLLRSSYGMMLSSQRTSLDLAYLVIPNTGTILVNGLASIGEGLPIVEVNSAPAWNGPTHEWNSDPQNTNWRCWGHRVAFHPGNDVQFTDSGIPRGGGQVQVTPAGVTPRHISVNSCEDYTFQGGPITAGGLRKLGEGEVTFNQPVYLSGEGEFLNGTLWANSTFSSATTRVGHSAIGGTGTISGELRVIYSTLLPGNRNGIGTLAVERLGFREFNSAISFDLSSAGADRLLITGRDGIALIDDTRFIRVILNDLGGATAGTYPLIQHNGNAIPDGEWLKVATPAVAGCAATLVNNPANSSIDLLLTPGSQWARDGDGSWLTSVNWSAAVPKTAGVPAVFGPVITAPRTIHVTSTLHVGEIYLDSPISFTFTGAPIFIRSGVDQNAVKGQSSLDVISGHHTIAAPITLGDDVTTISVVPASAQLTLSGHVSAWGTLVKSGAGTLKLTNVTSIRGRTLVDSGTLIMNAGFTPELYHEDEPQGGFEVARGAAIGGSGTITSTLTVSPGGIISPGEASDTPSRLTLGGLSLTDSLLKFDLTADGADRIVVTDPNKLLLFGVSMIHLNGEIGEGVFPLIDYSGTPLVDFGQLVLADVSVGEPSMSLWYNPANTSVDLVVGNSVSVPEPTALVFAPLATAMAQSRRRRSAQS